MDVALVVIDLLIVVVIYVGAVEMFTILGVKKSEAAWWYIEAFCRGLGRILGGSYDDDDNNPHTQS